MEEKVVHAENGIKCQVAMFIEASAENREGVDALVMSLPLGAALAVTKIKVEEDYDTCEEKFWVLKVELVPEAFAVEAMFDQVTKIIEEGAAVFFPSEPRVDFLCAETQQASVYEPPAALEGISLPGRRAIIIDGEETH